MIIIGVDPDSKAHGVAIYIDQELTGLKSTQLMEAYEMLLDLILDYGRSNILFSIENVCANNFVYARNASSNKNIMAKMGLSIGRCQQSQTELIRMLDFLEINYILHKPQKGNWAKNKKTFEQVTGWSKQSNEDTRSAAYFGWLGVNTINKR